MLSKGFNNVLPLGCRQRTPDQQRIYVEAGWTQIDIYRARRLNVRFAPDIKPLGPPQQNQAVCVPRRGRAIALPNFRLGLARMNARTKSKNRYSQTYWLRVRSVSARPNSKALLSRSLDVVLTTGS